MLRSPTITFVTEGVKFDELERMFKELEPAKKPMDIPGTQGVISMPTPGFPPMEMWRRVQTFGKIIWIREN